MHTPSSMTTPGPIITYGPILQSLPILALGSYIGKKALKIIQAAFKQQHNKKESEQNQAVFVAV